MTDMYNQLYKFFQSKFHHNVLLILIVDQRNVVWMVRVYKYVNQILVVSMLNAMVKIIVPIVLVLWVTQEILTLNVVQVCICLSLDKVIILKLKYYNIYFKFTVPKIPVIPAVPECYKNDDCNGDQTCFNERCINPCATNNHCAQGAFCYVENHQPVCRCPMGYLGQPTVECIPRKLLITKTHHGFNQAILTILINFFFIYSYNSYRWM